MDRLDRLSKQSDRQAGRQADERTDRSRLSACARDGEKSRQRLIAGFERYSERRAMDGFDPTTVERELPLVLAELDAQEVGAAAATVGVDGCGGTA
jgi:hypothetical protein